MSKIIVSVTNDLYTDQRVDKICKWLIKQNHDVLLVGRKLKTSKKMPVKPYRTYRMRLAFTKGPLFYAEYNVRLFFFLIFRKKDCLISNDLDTLLANFIASKFGKKHLVYDSHEYYTEVPELVSRPKVKEFWEWIERKIFPKLKHVYSVNDSIARFYNEKYQVPIHVIRNISPLFQLEKIQSKSDLGLPLDKKIIILQGAGINVDRGSEEMVLAMKDIHEAVFVIVGNGDVLPILKKMVDENNINHKVIFIGRQPYQVMMNYTWHADLGISLDKPNNLNYRYALPNKLFDYIHTNTPVLCSNTVEVSKIVLSHKIGEKIDTHNPSEIANKVNNIINNPELLDKYKANCIKAAQKLNWENESKKLHQIYEFLNE